MLFTIHTSINIAPIYQAHWQMMANICTGMRRESTGTKKLTSIIAAIIFINIYLKVTGYFDKNGSTSFSLANFMYSPLVSNTLTIDIIIFGFPSTIS